MIKPESQVPEIDLPLTNGMRFELSKQNPDNFTLVVFYRGKHCPACRKQLTELSSKHDEFTKREVNVVAVSMDSEDRAAVVHEEWETGNVPLAYDLSEEQARKWGLYISKGREDSDEPEKFSEPALFLVRPDGTLCYAAVQNMPFARSQFDDLLDGIDHMVENDYPTRGTLT